MKKEMDRWRELHIRPQKKAGIMIISNFLSRGQKMSSSAVPKPQGHRPRSFPHLNDKPESPNI